MEYSFYLGRQTLLHVQIKGRMPKYLQLADAINNGILKGALRKGEIVSYGPQGSTDLSISRRTIKKAFRALCDRGMLASCPRDRFYIVGNGTSARAGSEELENNRE